MASHDQLESICNILLLLLLLLYTRVLCPMGGHFKITLIIAPRYINRFLSKYYIWSHLQLDCAVSLVDQQSKKLITCFLFVTYQEFLFLFFFIFNSIQRIVIIIFFVVVNFTLKYVIIKSLKKSEHIIIV